LGFHGSQQKNFNARRKIWFRMPVKNKSLCSFRLNERQI